ncbi:MAG: SPASM domain-containing protein [Clostridiales bacterium]|nr:SPASM domain-containing protein [Clostridiales bacterium]
MLNKNKIIKIHDRKYNFVSYFNIENGDYLRTGILDKNGHDTNNEPFRASYPHLLDIGIMGHCQRGLSGNCTIDCYQSGKYINQPNMALDDYKKIIKESKNKVFQVALGGRGDPDAHENIEEILSFTRENNIIPNLTTSGYFITKEKAKMLKKYCGACAVSFYEDEFSNRALNLFLEEGITTNIHFVLSNKTINKAIDFLNNIKNYPALNRIIFLLYKPIGQGRDENILRVTDTRLKTLISLMEENIDKVGFDSCFVPAVVNFSDEISPLCYDACEAGRFSAYISPDLKMSPCSFERTGNFDVDINKTSIEDAWNSNVFQDFISKFKTSCVNCSKHEYCMGGCPITSKITLCNERG